MRQAPVAVLLPILALLLEPGPLASARPDGALADGKEPFSRARWIEQHERHSRFDGGALPALGPAPRRTGARDFAEKAPAAVNVQVSADLLPHDGGSAQAETQAEPFLAIDPIEERRLLAGWQEARFASGGARALAYAVSTTLGRKWTSGLVPGLTEATGGPWQRASDPWVAFGPDHRAYYASLAFDETRPANAIVVSTSIDGGRTWGDPVTVHRNDTTDFDDKEAMVVDNTRGPFRGRI